MPSTSATPAAEATFDVSILSQSDYIKGCRVFHVLGLWGSVAVGAGWVIALVVSVARGTLASDPTHSVVILGGGGGVGMLLAYAAVTFSRGANEVQVSSTGVRLTYVGGRTTAFVWHAPRVRLTLYQFPSILKDGRPFPLSTLWLVTRHPQSNPLTREAFDAIIESATSAGLLVTRRASRIGTPRSVIQIRHPEG